MRVFPIDGVAADYEELSSLTASTGFTATKIAPTTGDFADKKCRSVLISLDATAGTPSIRFCFDGTTPTGVKGHLLMFGASYEISGEKNIENFRAINADGSTGGILRCTFLF